MTKPLWSVGKPGFWINFRGPEDGARMLFRRMYGEEPEFCEEQVFYRGCRVSRTQAEQMRLITGGQIVPA